MKGCSSDGVVLSRAIWAHACAVRAHGSEFFFLPAQVELGSLLIYSV